MNVLFLGDYSPAYAQTSWEGSSVPRLGQGLSDRVAKCDVTVVNLECPLTRSTCAISKSGPAIKADPEWTGPLVDAGVGVVALANNHILDFGPQGLSDTLSVCRERGLTTMGAGETSEYAQQILLQSVGDQTLAMINVCEREWSVSANGGPGAAPLDVIENVRRIHEARQQADYVVMVVHAGNELTDYPPPLLVQTYRFFIEQGADAVVAHHAHCPQGYELYRGAPIIYSLGNFFFPNPAHFGNARWTEGCAVELVFPFVGPECLVWHPFRQCADATEELQWYDAEGTQEFLSRVEELSAPLTDLEDLETRWLDELRSRADVSLQYLRGGHGPIIGRWRALLRKLGLSKWMRPTPSVSNRLRLNLLRAQSLHELLVRRLEEVLQDDSR
jgi:hypothetical protein